MKIHAFCDVAVSNGRQLLMIRRVTVEPSRYGMDEGGDDVLWEGAW
jgi:hypothetical protein